MGTAWGNKRGVILFESVLLVLILTAVLAICQVHLIRFWRERIMALDALRLRYDGG